METTLTVDCALIEQSILNRYPLILVECVEQRNFNTIRLRLRPNSVMKEVQMTMQDYLDGMWEEKVDQAVRDLSAN
jgi:uncharacterized protein YlbG (UPF0298 family)